MINFFKDHHFPYEPFSRGIGLYWNDELECILKAQVRISQLAFYVNLHRAVIGPSATLTGRWRPNIDLRRMLTGKIMFIWTNYMSQHTTKPTIRLVRPAKTQISLRIRAAWLESSLIAYAFYSLQAIQREINESPCFLANQIRISHTLIRPVGKIKIANFHVFDIHWLYRTSKYVIVITLWRTSAIEVTALSNTHFQKWKVCKKKTLDTIMSVRNW